MCVGGWGWGMSVCGGGGVSRARVSVCMSGFVGGCVGGCMFVCVPASACEREHAHNRAWQRL